MQILPSGQVQITNNQTGETRVVDPSQLSAFSPLLANQYYNAMAESRANAKASGSGASSSSDVLQPPTGQMQTMPTNQNAPQIISGNSQLYNSMKPYGSQATPQAPLIGSGISQGDTGSATMGAPKSAPKPKPTTIKLNTTNSFKYPQFSGLNKF